MTTDPGGAPSNGAMRSPISIDIIHQRSPQARTPRVAHNSAYPASAPRVASGMAPSGWARGYFVFARRGTGAGKRGRGTGTIKDRLGSLAATHHDHAATGAEHAFREVLFYRLSVIPSDSPPLQEREDGILLVVSHFIWE